MTMHWIFYRWNSSSRTPWVGLATDSQPVFDTVCLLPSCADCACYKSLLEAESSPASTRTHHWASIGASQTHFVSGMRTPILRVCFYLLNTYLKTSTDPRKAALMNCSIDNSIDNFSLVIFILWLPDSFWIFDRPAMRQVIAATGSGENIDCAWKQEF